MTHITYNNQIKASWDSLLSKEYCELWAKFLYELNSLESVSINRYILCNCGNREIKINGFCHNYPPQAYCAVFYERAVCNHGVKVSLWTGKCRVPPIKDKNQPLRGVLKKRCSENMQQIYRRTPMPKCNFNKVAKQLY